MARSFYRPAADSVIEDYEKNNRFFHAASNLHYRMLRRDGRFFQQRYQLDQGREVNLFEQEIHYVIGSGNHAQLFESFRWRRSDAVADDVVSQERDGPLAGIRSKAALRLRARSTTAACFATITPKGRGADGYGRESVSAKLPNGIDCQRCHGLAHNMELAAARRVR
jgi:hypothetical protein